jgi:hypothetical protein
MDGTSDSAMVNGRSIMCNHMRVRPNTQTSSDSAVQPVEEAAQSERGKGAQGRRREDDKTDIRRIKPF